MTRGIVQGFAHDSIGFSRNLFTKSHYWESRALIRPVAERLQLGLLTSLGEKKVERVAGIEPAWPAWKAGTLPLSYTRNNDPDTILEWGEVKPKNEVCVCLRMSLRLL
jgi:hypothetical protein